MVLKIKDNFQQVSIFIVVGIVATITHYVVATCSSIVFMLTPIITNVFGFISAVGISFYGHSRFTFTSKCNDYPTIIKFLIVSLTCLVLSQLVSYYTYYQFNLGLLLSNACSVIVVPVVSFVLNKLWVFTNE